MTKYSINKFWGGMNGNSLYNKQGEILYSENLNITSYPDRVKTESSYERKFSTNGHTMYCGIQAVGLYQNIAWFAGESGEFYTNTSTDDTPKWTSSNTTTVKDVVKTNRHLYWVQVKSDGVRIIRMDELEAGDNSSAGIEDAWYESSTLGTTGEIGIGVWSSAEIAVFKGTKFSVVDSSTGAETMSDIDVKKTIIGMVQVVDNVKVFTSDGDIILYSIDGTIKSVTPTGVGIRKIKQINNKIYIIGSNFFGYNEGNEIVPIYIFERSLTDLEGQIEFGDSFIGFDGEQIVGNIYKQKESKEGLFTYGRQIEGFPAAFSIHSLGDFNRIESFTIKQYSTGVSNKYIGEYTPGLGRGVSECTGDKLQGKLISSIFAGRGVGTLKEIKELEIVGSFNKSSMEVIINGSKLSTSVSLDNGRNRNEKIKTTAFNEEFITMSVIINLGAGDELNAINISYTDNKE